LSKKIAGCDALDESSPVDFLQQKAESRTCQKFAPEIGAEFNSKNSYQSSQSLFLVQLTHCANQEIEMQKR
jgi:hypothetical protein